MKRLHPTDDECGFDTNNEGGSNRLADVTHIIMDEIHEESGVSFVFYHMNSCAQYDVLVIWPLQLNFIPFIRLPL